MKHTAKWIETKYREGDKIEVVEFDGKKLYKTPNSSSGITLDHDPTTSDYIKAKLVTDLGPQICSIIRFAIIHKDKIVTLTTDHSASSYGKPVVLLNDDLTDLHQYL